ncbi:extracellular solute-binding protein [Fimbriiglobus ruber]|uniref:Ferric iron ABC transporter, iron-binding protein n=1 Tax=Fimbriiglobus ruber TaxID=1908690 RepID=A0A225DYA2_9BACT|nr:extracellular solute-binding protein [Fimbriiglobus ruber]OWK41107.1 Ferric iron ABC transporter, iron-binding protein [Fimbriiglobus ruber]
MRSVHFLMSLGFLALLPLVSGCSTSEDQAGNVVVVYSSLDEEFAKPLAEQFEKETGIAVKLVSDTEKAQSSGLLNRLIEEKDRPQCDVFLSEDPVRSAVLKQKGISEPYLSPAATGLRPEFSDPDHHWTAMSARVRVLLINKKHPIFKTEPFPTSVYDLADPCYKGKVCIGNPLFGTTTLHCLAIFHYLGEEKAKQLFEDMLKNEVHVLPSDGDVEDRVEKGDFAFGLTDNDDGMTAIRESKGKKMDMVIPDEKGLGMLAPDAPVLIKNCPNPDNAKKFIDFMLRPETELALARTASQIPLRPDLKMPDDFAYPPFERMRGIPVNYSDLADRHDALVQGYLKDWTDRNANR